MAHQATGVKGSRISVEAALFSEARKAILLKHYDYTRQLRLPEFEAAKDTFDYSQPVPTAMEEAFATTCAPLRKHFP